MDKGVLKRVFLFTILAVILCVPFIVGVTRSYGVIGSGTFELDGNTADPTPTILPDDFDCVYSGCSNAVINSFVTDSDFSGDPDTTTFGQGDKDIQPIENIWNCNVDNNVLGKDNILNAYTAAYRIPDGLGGTDLVVFFGDNREKTEGSSNVGFWFFQNLVACTPTALGGTGLFTGHKTHGDLFIVSEFDSGGRVSNVKVYMWTDPTPASPESGDECLGDGVDCTTAHAGQPFVTGNDCVTGAKIHHWSAQQSTATEIQKQTIQLSQHGG